MDPFVGGMIISGISSLFGGLAGQSETDARNREIRAQHEQNKLAYKFGKKKIKADYRHEKDQWRMNVQNEEARTKWLDETNLQNWIHDLKIQEFEYRSQMRQFAKSENIYGQQLTFNRMAAESAREAEQRKLEDAVNDLAYQNQDIVLKALQAEGALAAKGQVGKSADKGMSAEFASLGRNQAILFDSLVSAKADTSQALRKISSDKYGADIAAQAARMLEPERLPIRPKPPATPETKFLAPRRPRNYDFGVPPKMGAMASSAPAWIGAAGNFATGITGGVISSMGGGKSGIGSFDVNSITAKSWG